MLNPYLSQPATITNIKEQNLLIKLFEIELEKPNVLKFIPGQFIILSLPGYGEAPFAVCSSPNQNKKFEICVQKKGAVTTKLFSLKVSNKVGIRGPYGNGFPMSKFKNKNLALVAGGLGLVPLRSLIKEILENPSAFGKVQIFHGCRQMELLLFRDEYEIWQSKIELNLTLDTPCADWKGNIGIITTLFDKIKIALSANVIMCGPPIMFRFVMEKLSQQNISQENIYLTLERRMHCGIGVCQHCILVGGKYVCKDGPVFRYDQIKNLPDVI